jgi:putative transposase
LIISGLSVDPSQHRKRVKHFHEPGDLHELTFSCYRRLKLLTNNPWKEKLSREIDEACEAEQLLLIAFVYMPEHVHLLLWPLTNEPRIDIFLKRIKRPVSVLARDNLRASGSRLLDQLTIRERPGKTVFRFWQEGPGYDRNLQTAQAVQASIDYIHLNPVKRGLCQQASNWRWSSARYYESGGRNVDPALPKLAFLPPEFWLELATRG